MASVSLEVFGDGGLGGNIQAPELDFVRAVADIVSFVQTSW